MLVHDRPAAAEYAYRRIIAGVGGSSGAEGVSVEGHRAALALTAVLTVRTASAPSARLALWRQVCVLHTCMASCAR